jgi:UDP-N-acetylmuramyl pentapeptide phosphotransferase/UDP-N-acetylglucosamine-1-phosphate transferase
VSLAPPLVAGALSAGLSWLIVGLVRDAAGRRGLLDMPNARSSHALPTPRLGGLGIVAAVAVSIGAAQALFVLDSRAAVILVGLGAAVALVSLVDDLRGLPALVRLAVHLAAGAAAVASLGPLDVIGDLGVTDPGVARRIDSVLTVLWIAGFMNAFNFMDGIDGIAGGQALVAGAATAAIGWLLGVPSAALLGLTLAGACLGFLPHNWSPATIFMGDVGSAFLGFLIATAPMVAPATAGPPVGLLAFALVVWPFLFDTMLTFVRRAVRGENVMAAHKTHLYQRLTQAGWSHGRVAALYAGLAGVAAVLVVLPPAQGRPNLPAVAFVAVAASALWLLVVQAERHLKFRPAGAAEGSRRA